MAQAVSEDKLSVKAKQVEDVDMPAVQDNAAISEQTDIRIRRSFDRHLLPIVCCLYILSYLDRGNIGNAKAARAKSDLKLSDSEWAWVLNSFYIAYVVFEWTNLLWKILPASKYVAVLCILWGTAAMSSGAAHNLGSLAASRAFLGLFEAAFGAGAPYFLSMFYKRRELGFRVSLLIGMSPLANCFASALAFGITQIRGSLEPWRYLFIIVFAGMTDYQNYVHTLIHFCNNYSFAALSNFLPTIVRDMGYSSVTAQGLTAPPYLAAFVCCVAAAWASDRYGMRGFIVSGGSVMATAGYLILVLIRDESKIAARYTGVFLASCGIFPAMCINITWLLNNQGGDSKKGAGLAILATLGQCSSFMSTDLLDNPFYTKGTAIGCGLAGITGIAAIGLHFALEYENHKRDLEFGPVDENTVIDVTEVGDKHHSFRYLT
ncbi:hypothetical protein K456DRAFT_1752058 [Colletotrichum gloeosporioides 23]|nr:hypothetical protein K456DRAFT_1752058 [Colletotrichum gloeosporioides 23]